MLQIIVRAQAEQPIAIELGSIDRPHYHVYKRTMDIVLSTALLVVLAPVLLLIAVLIRLDSPGPAIFVQERVSARRRVRDGMVVWETYNFRIYKFRSMVDNADQAVHHAYIKRFIEGGGSSATGPDGMFKLNTDQRVTRLGRILRKTSLDELPQLLNVLAGHMSLVGPRPVPGYEVREYQPQHCQRLAAVPGITGLWQVKGRSQVTFEQMVEMDVAYARTQSLWFDVALLLQTVAVVSRGRGAV